MSIAYQKFRDTRFFGSLDGLRALSILGVIWFHSWYGTPRYPWLESTAVLRNGRFGVEVFFAISGFLITTLLIRERLKYQTVALRDFYIRRSLRIWPLYYAVLGLYVVLVLLTEHDTERGRAFFHYLPTYLTYTYTWFGPRGAEPGAIFNFAWSLSTEEQFYLFWPLIIKLLRWPLAIAMVSAVVAVRVLAGLNPIAQLLGPESLGYHILMSISVPICLGALLSQVLHRPGGFRFLYSVLGWKWSAPVALAALIVCLIPMASPWMPVTWIVLTLLVGSCVIREDHGLAKLLRFKPLAYIGVLSYGMYLYNTLMVKALWPVAGHLGLHHPLLVFPLLLGATVLVSWLSYRYFESPFLTLKERFSRLKPAPSAVAPVAIVSAETHHAVHP
jgi:peptidoglycan/LPS O-acetylase OafA/YrhL